ncbi:macrodontain-1-like [Leguminivora glycinivorella]|uniref:macrodontain-1-like n=1 Tax=Leguminivora glycinivorella TaxID=1035111 RepID=UPI00200D3E4E|nr:macrodontain-1-like [Leguminivora glycinivorella]
MFVPIVLAAVCLASITVLAATDKPYYDVEDAENLFESFLQKHNKVYKNRREYYERLGIFKKTLKDLNERNAMFPDTVFALDHFADLYPEELQSYFGFKLPENMTGIILPDGPTPTEEHFDWRERGAVSRVKEQLNCGSCYIFSAVGNIEGQYAIKNEVCLAFSEGQVLDCLTTGTCAGGYMHEVFQELAQKKMKLETETSYPYKDKKGNCSANAKMGRVLVTRGNQIRIADEEELKNKLVNLGPLSVGLNANDFVGYEKGILEPHRCIGRKINHAVLLVGFGEEKGKKYWILKNSWGKFWGQEKGYVRLRRGVNACRMGTNYTASSEVA